MNRSKFHVITFICLCSVVALSQAGTPPPSAPAGSASVQSEKPSSSPSTTPAQPAQQPGSLVPETTPVITVEGVCDISSNGTPKPAANATKASSSGTLKAPIHTGTGARAKAGSNSAASRDSASGDCKTQITRAEFEKLMKAVAPGVPQQAWRQIATRYVQFLTEANEAVKLGIDKEPEFPEQLAIVRLQFLAQSAERKLQTQASTVSEAELKNYYDQNPSAFEEVTLTRLFVPRMPADPKQTEPPADAKAIADNARQQLMIGGDPDKIQKSIYDQLKNTNPAPSSKFGARRRGTLPGPQEQKLFAMKDGEVSDVIEDPTGYVVYRVDEKRELPFDQVKDDVKQRIARQRIADVKQQMLDASKANYDDAYFGPEVSNPRLGPPSGTPQGTRPPSTQPGSVPPASESNHPQSSPPTTTPK